MWANQESSAFECRESFLLRGIVNLYKKKMKNKEKFFTKNFVVPCIIAGLAFAVFPAYSVIDNNRDVVDSVNLNITGVVTVYNKDSLQGDKKPIGFYTVTEKTLLSDILKKHQLDPDDFSFMDGTPITGEETVSVGDNMKIFDKNFSSSVENIDITLPDVIEKTDELFLGETETVTEGVVGKSTKTTITYNVLKNDGNIETEKEETVSVKVKPVAKVVREGTKPRVATQSFSAGRPPYAPWSGYSYDPSPYLQGDFLDTALKQVGKPYVWAAAGPHAFDCSGFIQWVYKQHGISVPRTAHAQGVSAQQISWSEAKRGDLIYTSGHIGFYLGNGMMVHAANPGAGVTISSVSWMVSHGAKVARVG